MGCPPLLGRELFLLSAGGKVLEQFRQERQQVGEEQQDQLENVHTRLRFGLPRNCAVTTSWFVEYPSLVETLDAERDRKSPSWNARLERGQLKTGRQFGPARDAVDRDLLQDGPQVG